MGIPSLVRFNFVGFRAYRNALLGGTTLATAFLLPSLAHAQSVWGGTGSTTTTSDYNLGTNWSNPPAGAPPVNGGQSAQFGNTGSSTVTVTAGPITPDSWTFNANSQSYTVSGQAVNFTTGITNNASSGQAISVANNIAGSAAVIQNGASTLTLSGANTYTGVTFVGGGTLAGGAANAFSAASTTTIATGGTIDLGGFAQTINSVSILNGYLKNGALTGAVAATDGKLSNVGGAMSLTVNVGSTTIAGINTYTGATLVHSSGALVGSNANAFSATSATTVTGGTLDLGGFAQTINSVTLASGFLTHGSLSGAVTVTGLANINNVSGGMSLTANAMVLMGGTNSYSGATTVNNGAQLFALNDNAFSANSATTVNTGGLLNLGSSSQTIGSLAGGGNVILGNNLTVGLDNSSTTYSGVMSDTGGFTKSGSGTMTLSGANTYTGVSSVTGGKLVIAAGGGITSNIGVSQGTELDNFGSIAGHLTNSGIYTQNAGATVGSTTNTGSISANGGAFNGAIQNDASGHFYVNGTVTSDSSFNNSAATSLLHVVNGGTYTVSGLVTNSGTIGSMGGIVVETGGFLNATGGILNASGATIFNYGRIDGALDNAGNVVNNLTYNANVVSNSGSGIIVNSAGATWTGNVQSNSATIYNGGTWTGSITNTGTLGNEASATVSGLVTSNAGLVLNDGALNGGAIINGGTLTGTGSIAGLAVNGGTFAPGNGTPGTSMTVTGNLAFQSAAQYLVTLNPATSSFTNVTGTATLGGATVDAVFASGTYVVKRYTIVSAGSISGTFNPAVTNSNLPSGFQTTLSYDANNAYLNLVLAFTPPSGSGLSGNQQNVGNSLINFFNTNGSIPIVFGSLTPAGLTQISGETATGSQQTTFNAMGQFMGVMTDPFVAGRGDPLTAGGHPNAYADEESPSHAAGKPRSQSERDAYAAMSTKAPPPTNAFVQRWNVWAAGFGGSQTTDGNTALGSNGTNSSIYGAAVGADYRLSWDTLAGFALAGGGTNFSAANGGTGRSDLFQAGAFIRHNIGAAYLMGALAYGWQDVTTDRTVTVAGVDRLRAEFNANTWSGRLEGGYRFVAPWMGGIGLTPYAAGQFTTFKLPAYAEGVVSGASTFALSYAAKSVTDTRTELGLRTDKSFAMQDAILTLRGRAAWAHDFNPDHSIGATFQSLPGASFVVNGAALAADSALATASAEIKWIHGWSAAATFEGEFSNVTRSYAGKGVVRYAW